MRALACAISFFLGATALPVLAESTIDGKAALICANVEGMVCERGEHCSKGLPEDIGAPSFMRIDFAKNEVIGPKRTSPIRQMETDDELISLQGFELGMGWTISIERETGHFTSTLAGMDKAFVFFGACTEQTWSK